MKGTHTIEGLMLWIDSAEIDPVMKIGLKRKIKNAADKASTTGKQGLLKLMYHGKELMAIRFYEDGSCEAGWQEGQKPTIVPAPEKDFV